MTKPSDVLQDLARDFWETLMRLKPLLATFYKHPSGHDALDDISAEGRAREREAWSGLLSRLRGIDPGTLPENDRISWEMLKLRLEDRIGWLDRGMWQWSVVHLDGPQSDIPSMVALGQPMAAAEDAQALIARVAAMPAYFKNHVDNLRASAKAGRRAARKPVEKTIEQLEGLLKEPADRSPFAKAAERLPESLKKKYAPLVAAEVERSAYAAYRGYHRFLKEELLAGTRSDEKPGLCSLPGGPDLYRHQMRFHTTLDKPPEEIHRIGMDELEEIHSGMDKIARSMGHSGSLDSFIEKVRNDPANFFADRGGVVKAAETLVAETYSRLPRFFGKLPATPLIVKAIEEYRENGFPAGFYYQPPADLSRPGVYYINTHEPHTRPRFGMASLTVHEGVPGHHLQLALAAENKDLPMFRRNLGPNSYIEGWALYCELLGEEMGLYPDDLSRLGMLTNQALRACRLVVDTGLHAMGWSRAKAIGFMKDNMPMSEGEIVAEVDRYVIWPGQALAYKMGQREISALRRESQAAHNGGFDIRAFHDRVLQYGALPLLILRRVVLGGSYPQTLRAES